MMQIFYFVFFLLFAPHSPSSGPTYLCQVFRRKYVLVFLHYDFIKGMCCHFRKHKKNQLFKFDNGIFCFPYQSQSQLVTISHNE